MKLGALVTASKGVKPAVARTTPQQGDIRLLRAADLRGEAATAFSPAEPGSIIAGPTDIVIAWDGTVGTSRYGVTGLVGSTLGLLRVRDGSVVHPPYLGHFLKWKEVYLRERSKGAAVPHLDPDVLLSLEVPLPCLIEQRRVAALLDEATNLLARRRSSLSVRAGLEQSTFVSAFGSPLENPHNHTLVPLSALGALDRGVSRHRPRNDPSLLGGPYPFVQTGDVANSGGYVRTHSASYSEAGLAQSKLWPRGTLCITIAANIGKTGILTFDACFPDSVVGFTADRDTTTFVRVWLSFLQGALEKSAPQSAQKNINLGVLRSLAVPWPGKSSLRAFSNVIDDIAIDQQLARSSLSAVEDLMSSLHLTTFAAHETPAGRGER